MIAFELALAGDGDAYHHKRDNHHPAGADRRGAQTAKWAEASAEPSC